MHIIKIQPIDQTEWKVVFMSRPINNCLSRGIYCAFRSYPPAPSPHQNPHRIIFSPNIEVAAEPNVCWVHKPTKNVCFTLFFKMQFPPCHLPTTILLYIIYTPVFTSSRWILFPSSALWPNRSSLLCFACSHSCCFNKLTMQPVLNYIVLVVRIGEPSFSFEATW